MTERVYAEISDGRKGWYIVAEEHPDGSLVVVPDQEAPAAYRIEGKAVDASDVAPPE